MIRTVDFFFFLLPFTAPGIYLLVLPLSWEWAVITHLVVTALGTLYLEARNTVAEAVVFTVILSLLVSFNIRACHRIRSPKGTNVNAIPSSETSEDQLDPQR